MNETKPIRSDVAELFAAASFTREDAPEVFDDLAQQMENILDALMANDAAHRLSCSPNTARRLSWSKQRQVEIYEEQKASLIADLEKMKREKA